MNKELLEIIASLMKHLPEEERKEIQPKLNKAIGIEKQIIQHLKWQADEWK